MDLNKIKNNLKVNFNDDNLLTMAFTHSSYANTHHISSNERLEFLGDSILNFVTTDFLYKNFDREEGYLSKLRAYLVSADNLSLIVDKLDIIDQLNFDNFSAKNSKNVKCDLFEAIVGAIYLDSGIDSAKNFIVSTLNLIKQEVLNCTENKIDYKTKLQEIVQQSGKNTIEYVLISASTNNYQVALKIDGKVVATSQASSKKQAERNCAKQACEKLSE